MKRFTMFACLVMALTFSLNALADDGDLIRPHDIRGPGVVRGGSMDMAKALGDSFVLIGPPELFPTVIGTFQDAGGAPAWNGWTTLDWTIPDTLDTTWHAATYYAINGVYSAYCGDETIPSCGPGDPDGGYQNSWTKLLKWGATVTDVGLTTNITVDFAFDVDSEGGYDWGFISRELENEEREDIWGLSGDSTGTISVPVTYASGEYFGDNLDEIGIWFVGQSDGGWSDGDCDYPSTGIWRIDDVTITADNGAGGTGLITFEDGTLGVLERKFLGAVGDFTHLASNLGDPDLCQSNGTPQVTFIDDGVIQPATGGSFATSDNRKYAMGYVTNYTGGLTFSEQRHMRNSAVSPAVPWGDITHDGISVGYTYMTDSPHAGGETGIYMEWFLRSTAGDEASLEDAIWQHSPYVYTGGPWYGRRFWDASDNLEQGRTFIQFAVGANETGYVWGVDGHNGTPSPYYDNIRVESFPYEGPNMYTQTLRLPHDDFPEIGIIDTVDLSRNSIRFDQAQNISPTTHEWYYNGDSLTIDVVAVRTGAALTARPTMHWKIQRNPLFDPYRLSLADSGTVLMDTTFTPTGTVVSDRFNCDLPDTGFLFPGDVVHYYFTAEDAIFPGGTAPFTSYMPADIDGYGNFTDPEAWSSTYTVRGLPSVIEDVANPGEYICPPVLFWDDAESETRGTKNEWYGAFENLGLIQGTHFDTYYGKAPSSGVGTGVSSRASTNQLDWYSELIYSAGYLTTSTIGNGDWGTASGDDDITRLENWLDEGNKDLFISGNGVCFDLNTAGAAAGAFLSSRMGLTYNADTHRDLLGGQLAPRVLTVAGNPVIATVDSWIAFGGCPQLWDFNLVTPSGSTRLAEFANASGTPGGYGFSPVTLNILGTGSRVITMTADLAYVHTDANEGAKANATQSARVRLLRDILGYFGVSENIGLATGVTPFAGKFALENAPNPFNPITKISYTIKAPGHMTLKVFNVRGELVKTLINGHVEADSFIEWDGTNSQGGKVSSGVYFYQAQMGNDVQVHKMALVK